MKTDRMLPQDYFSDRAGIVELLSQVRDMFVKERDVDKEEHSRLVLFTVEELNALGIANVAEGIIFIDFFDRKTKKSIFKDGQKAFLKYNFDEKDKERVSLIIGSPKKLFEVTTNVDKEGRLTLNDLTLDDEIIDGTTVFYGLNNSLFKSILKLKDLKINSAGITDFFANFLSFPFDWEIENSKNYQFDRSLTETVSSDKNGTYYVYSPANVTHALMDENGNIGSEMEVEDESVSITWFDDEKRANAEYRFQIEMFDIDPGYEYFVTFKLTDFHDDGTYEVEMKEEIIPTR